MMQNPSMVQKRIISNFVRRTIQGWGKPLVYTTKRLQLGGLFVLVALVLSTIESALFGGPASVVHPQSSVNAFVSLLALLCLCVAVGLFWTSLIPYIRATQQQPERITGTVDAAICNVEEIVPYAREGYHYITLRQANGQLRPFAIGPEFHDQACQPGQRVTLTFIPGIEQVTRVVEG